MGWKLKIQPSEWHKMTTRANLVKRGSISIPPDNRRMYIKRLQINGSYETNWYDISKYVISWGTISQGFPDDIYVGEFIDEDIQIALDNSTRIFNDIDDYKSLFRGYLSRFKCKFKIELYAEDDDESDVLLRSWYGIFLNDIKQSDIQVVEFTLSSVLKVFQLYNASGITVTSADTETLITRLVNKTDVSGNSIFSKYFEGFSINPNSEIVTTISHPYIEEKESVLDKIKDYSLYDNFFYYVDDDGCFVWDSKEPTATVQWEFNGAGNTDSTYGTNIIKINSLYQDADNTYTRVSIDYAENSIIDRSTFFNSTRKDDNTANYLTEANSASIYDALVTASYIGTGSKLTQLYITSPIDWDTFDSGNWADWEDNIKKKLDDTIKASSLNYNIESSWTVGDGSIGDVYGVKAYNETMTELVTSEASTVGNTIYDAYKAIKTVIEATVWGAYHLKPKDKITVNYLGEINVVNPFIIGVSEIGGTDVIAGRTGSIRLKDESMKIERINIDLDSLEITMKWREV